MRIHRYEKCTCSPEDPKCPKCRGFVRECLVHPSNFCDACDVRLCWGCTHHCNKAVQCPRCERYRLSGTFKRCEVCQEGFCLPCRNELFDINIKDEVCMIHKTKCQHTYTLANFPKSLPKVPCDQSLYLLPSYKCQYDQCTSYACEGTIMEMEVKGMKDVRICHGHVFNCFSCESRRPMTMRGVITMYQEERQGCLKCYTAWKTFIECVLIVGKRMSRFSDMRLMAWLVMRRSKGRVWFA